MTETPQSRESLSLRIDSKIKQQYENRIYEKFGRLEPYTGTELERELRVLIGQGELSKLVDKTQELARALGEDLSENKNSRPERSGNSEVVGYRIHSGVRAELKEEAQSAADVNYASDLVEFVMWAYACGNESESKVGDRLDRIKNFVEAKTSDKDVKLRRTESIIEELPSEDFQLKDFDKAVDEGPEGLNAGDYAREEYLPRVVEHGDYVVHPDQPKLLIPSEKIDVSDQDPRNKPPVLRNEEDLIKIILTDALESTKPTRKMIYTPADAADALGEGITKRKAQKKFKEVTARSEQIEYNRSENQLEIKPKVDSNSDSKYEGRSEAYNKAVNRFDQDE